MALQVQPEHPVAHRPAVQPAKLRGDLLVGLLVGAPEGETGPVPEQRADGVGEEAEQVGQLDLSGLGQRGQRVGCEPG